METVQVILEGLKIYGWIGLAVAACFLLVGIERVDDGAKGAYAFRPLLIPGLVPFAECRSRRCARSCQADW